MVLFSMNEIMNESIRSFGVSIWPKNRFLQYFCCQQDQLIVTNDNQQFLAHFDRFLSIFQISDVKLELSPVKLKVRKNGIFWVKNLFQKNFPRLFLSPNKSYVKKLGQNGP